MYASPSHSALPARRYRDHLPPVALGLDAIARLAEALHDDLQNGQVDASTCHDALLIAYMAAAPALARLVARSAEIPLEDADDVVQDVGARLGAVFDRWRRELREPASFGGYLRVTLDREARLNTRRTSRERSGQDALRERCAQEDGRESGEPPLTPLHQQALRRYIWYLYGSPDNPGRASHSMAMADFLALMTRLQGRPFQWLVDECQPRPGVWSPREGHDPSHWWRNRAAFAYRRLVASLSDPENYRVYSHICAELGLAPP